MTSPVAISIDSAATPATRDVVRATVATLPQSFRLTSGLGTVVAVDGRGEWGARTVSAVDAGAKAVLVIDPHELPSEDVSAVIGVRAPVVLDTPWRHNNLVPRIAPFFHKVDAAGSMLEARTTVRSASQMRGSITALAFTACALLGAPIRGLRDVVAQTNHLTVFGTAESGLLLRLSAVVGTEPTERADFRLVGTDQVTTAVLPSAESGDSGIGIFIDASSKVTLPSAFESSHRTALSIVEQLLMTNAESSDVADFLAVSFATSRLLRTD